MLLMHELIKILLNYHQDHDFLKLSKPPVMTKDYGKEEVILRLENLDTYMLQ